MSAENTTGRRRVGRVLIVAALLATLVVSPAIAAGADDTPTVTVDDEAKEDFKNTMENIGTFLTIVIAAVAIPNGAFGIFQWMTAGTDTEQSDKGRKRIRNSFVGIGGAAVILVLVRLLTSFVGI